MMAESIDVGVDGSFWTHKMSEGKLRELMRVFGSVTETGGVERSKGVLWEGFFGILEGPQIVPESTRSINMTATPLVGDSVHGAFRAYKRWGRTTPGPLATVSNGGNPNTNLALVAFRHRLSLQGSFVPNVALGPVTVVPGNIIDADVSRIEHDDTVINPYGVPGSRLTFLKDSGRNNNLNDQRPIDTLFFTGRISVGSTLSTADFIRGVAQQTLVVEEVSDGAVGADRVYQQYGVSDQEQLAELWGGATRQCSPVAAARFVMNQLGTLQ